MIRTKAKFHLKKAGLSSLSVKLSTSDAAYEGAVDAATLWSESAKQCGIDIQVVREPKDGYWSNVWLKKDWSMCFWGGRPTEDAMFTVAYSKGAAWNDAYWSHERFNNLLVEARAELNDNLRREMYGEMQRIVRDEGGTPCMMYANYVSANSDKIANDGNIAINWTATAFAPPSGGGLPEPEENSAHSKRDSGAALTVAAFGDSLSAGFGLTNGDGFAPGAAAGNCGGWACRRRWSAPR